MALGDQGKARAETKAQKEAQIEGEKEGEQTPLSEKARLEGYRLGGFKAAS